MLHWSENLELVDVYAGVARFEASKRKSFSDKWNTRE